MDLSDCVMTTVNKTYIGLALALAFSLALPYVLPVNDFVNFVATLGATIALGEAYSNC